MPDQDWPADPAGAGDHDELIVPPSLLELHEVLEWQAAVEEES